MQLEAEWNRRIDLWFEELRHYVFSRLEEIEFSGWVTKERLSYKEAMKHQFKLMVPGTPWGAKWEYGWFRAEFTLPRSAEGHRIYLHPEVGGEMIVWVNGEIAGSRDLQHGGITLTRDGHEGGHYEIVVESYAGHGVRLENGGPCPPERVAVPEPPSCQIAVGTSDFGIWNEDAYQLLLDVYTLKRLYQGLEPRTLRAMKVREGLEKFTNMVDYELEPEERMETFRQARTVLKPLLACTNGSTVPVFTIFGQSHLDLAWKWPWEETRRKCARTISSQLALSDEYEEYQFLLCEPPIMENLKENYPELYKRVQEKVKKGAFIPEGGLYVESDTNLVSGESLVRQCLYGRRWFREEMAVESVMVWLPDCFGFSGQLPQIMIKCGLQYFATQKLSRALKGCDVFPYNTFMWKGIDGTKILADFHRENNAKIEPLDMMKRWNEDRVQQEHIDTFLYPFGYGDGGGGPTREMVEIARRCKDLEGVPRTKMRSPRAYFEELEQNGLPEETYEGELYLPWHRGTFTSQARMKAANRRTENALREAELWNTLGNYMGFVGLRQEKLEDLWKILLFNQFHDVLPGTSITRVYEDALRDLQRVREGANAICQTICKALIQKSQGAAGEKGYTIFNSLSWERTELIKVPVGAGDSWQQEGERLPVQSVKDGFMVPVRIPSCGFAVITPDSLEDGTGKERALEPACHIYEENGTFILENLYLRAVVNYLGQVISLMEKDTEAEYAADVCNVLCMYQDVNVDYDAWELSAFYEKRPVALEEQAEIRITAEGPLAVAIEVRRVLHHSPVVQEIVMKYNSRRIDFKTRIDWQETHKLLKVVFPFDIHAEEAVEEIPFGCIRRPTHQNRRYDADRFEVCNRHYTALTEPGRTGAVLNDCKYGVSTRENRIELTLLKAPVWPDMYADQGIHEFTYSMYAYPGSLAESETVREGYELNHELVLGEKGGEKGSGPLFEISACNVILEAVKMPEDRRTDIILRLYESAGSHGTCTIKSPLSFGSAWEVDMEEDMEKGKKLSIEMIGESSSFHLKWKPFEIKTVRLVKASE